MSANHILQNYLSTENFPVWKWALRVSQLNVNSLSLLAGVGSAI